MTRRLRDPHAPRSRAMLLRLTAEERDQLHRTAEALGEPTAQWIRKLALERARLVVAKLTRKEPLSGTARDGDTDSGAKRIALAMEIYDSPLDDVTVMAVFVAAMKVRAPNMRIAVTFDRRVRKQATGEKKKDGA